MLIFVLACTSAPVVQVVDDTTLLSSVLSAEEQRTELKSSNQAYTKAENVQVDVAYLIGRLHNDVALTLSEQLGPLEQKLVLDMDMGSKMIHRDGTVSVYRGEIYELTVKFEPALRRGEALESIGFPPYADRYLKTHREFRLENVFECKRFRFIRAEKHSQEIAEIKVMKWSPRDRR